MGKSLLMIAVGAALLLWTNKAQSQEQQFEMRQRQVPAVCMRDNTFQEFVNAGQFFPIVNGYTNSLESDNVLYLSVWWESAKDGGWMMTMTKAGEGMTCLVAVGEKMVVNDIPEGDPS